MNGLPANQIRARFHGIPTGVHGHRLRRPVCGRPNTLTRRWAGIKADEQTIAAVVAGKLNVPKAAASCHEYDVAGDADEPTDEYAIE